MDNKRKQKIVDLVSTQGKAQAARQLGVPRSTLHTQWKKAITEGFKPGGLTPEDAVERDVQIDRLRDELKSLKSKYTAQAELLNLARRELKLATTLEDLSDRILPPDFKVKRSTKQGEAVAFGVGSDWHLEEVVRPEAIHGLNEYNLAIARSSIESFYVNLAKLTRMAQGENRIDTLVHPLIGDLISGYIHDELVETNSLSPIEAVLEASSLAIAGLTHLIEHAGVDRVVVVFAAGNHGRTTKRLRIKSRMKTSYETFIYHHVMQAFANEERISFRLCEGYSTFIDIFDWPIRIHHGDAVRYQGGIGGVHIPLNKAIAGWNKAKRARLDILGHWHTHKHDFTYVINGSVIGYSEYSEFIKADYEDPCQTFFCMHPRYGKILTTPIHVR